MRALRRAARPLSVRAVGLVTPVGLSARASAAALRAGVMRFQELPFHDGAGNFVIGAPVPRVTDGRTGLRRLVAMLATALRDASSQLEGGLAPSLPLLVALAERDRPGRPARLEERLLTELEAELGIGFDHARSLAYPRGGTAFHRALADARDLLEDPAIPAVVVAAVDSWLSGDGIDHLLDLRRLKMPADPDGVIPGEGAVALVVERGGAADSLLEISGLGFATESADLDKDEPLIGVGLAGAVRAALADAGQTAEATWFTLSDAAGDRRAFTEVTYATERTRPNRHEPLALWLPAESFGDMGAVSAGAQIAIAATAFAKEYAPGPGALCQAQNRNGERAVALLQSATA